MRKILRWLLLCSFVCLAAPAWKILPGKAYGPISLGLSVQQAEQQVGPPLAQEKRSGGCVFKTYKGFLALLINQDGKVIGITVGGPEARTAEEVGPGSTLAQVEARYGKGLSRGGGQVSYPERGLSLAYDAQGKVERVFVVQPEAVQPLQGDRLIVAGRRIGDLKLGMPLNELVSAWGRPDQQDGNTLRWQSKSVAVTVENGQVLFVTFTTGDYVTAKGIKVGSTRSEVSRLYASQKTPQWMYPKLGIGFHFAGEVVSTIQVFPVQP
jgi:hypothetical protein